MWLVSLALITLLVGVVLLAGAESARARGRRVEPVGLLGLALSVVSLLILWVLH